MGYRHRSVNHTAQEYVRGEVHTQSIDSFWALLKRGIIGTYHNVSEILPLYLAELRLPVQTIAMSRIYWARR